MNACPPTPAAPAEVPPQPLQVIASDGYPIRGFAWTHPAYSEANPTSAASATSVIATPPAQANPAPEWPGRLPISLPTPLPNTSDSQKHSVSGSPQLVIINPATSVRCRYYFKFARFLHAHGFDVLTYDYRGIGESHPGSLKGFKASYLDWGCLDFEAILRHARRTYPAHRIHVVGHSIGGFVIGLAASNIHIERIFTMGAQFAYWPDYLAPKRLGMLLKWHLFMPAVTALAGYFPASRLGWMEDTPKGVVRQWSTLHREFGRGAWTPAAHHALRSVPESFAGIVAPTLALSVTDDEYGTQPAIERLLGLQQNSTERIHLRISPDSIQRPEIGHFAFFQNRFREPLWEIPLHWLREGRLPAHPPGALSRLGGIPPPKARAS